MCWQAVSALVHVDLADMVLQGDFCPAARDLLERVLRAGRSAKKGVRSRSPHRCGTLHLDAAGRFDIPGATDDRMDVSGVGPRSAVTRRYQGHE